MLKYPLERAEFIEESGVKLYDDIADNSGWYWSSVRERTVIMMAQGASQQEVARFLGIGHDKINRWTRRPEWAARLAEERETWRQAIRQRGIALLERRVDEGIERHSLIKEVIRQRAEEMDGEAPGGSTGLLTRKIKPLKDGGYATEYAVDTGLLGEMRATEKQVAQELGQWTESTTPAGRGLPAGATIGVRVLVGVDIDLL